MSIRDMICIAAYDHVPAFDVRKSHQALAWRTAPFCIFLIMESTLLLGKHCLDIFESVCILQAEHIAAFIGRMDQQRSIILPFLCVQDEINAQQTQQKKKKNNRERSHGFSKIHTDVNGADYC